MNQVVSRLRTMQLTTPKCRLCGADLTHEVLNLGMSPPCELFLRADQTDDMEPFYPLHVVCVRELFPCSTGMNS